MVLLRERAAQQSDAAQLELYQLQVDSNRSQLLLRRHAGLLDGAGALGGRPERRAGGRGGAAGPQLPACPTDVPQQGTRLRDLRVLVSTSEDARACAGTGLGAAAQQELAVLNGVTEDLRPAD